MFSGTDFLLLKWISGPNLDSEQTGVNRQQKLVLNDKQDCKREAYDDALALQAFHHTVS